MNQEKKYLKHEMLNFLEYRGVNLSLMDCPVKAVEKRFREMGGYNYTYCYKCDYEYNHNEVNNCYCK